MKPFVKSAVTLFLATALIVVQIGNADAGKGRRRAAAFGFAAGAIGLGLLGVAADAEARRRGAAGYYRGGCYPGPRECEYVERSCYYNDYGDQICPAPYRRCYRRQFCE
jgi:hypothetical protein